MNIGRIIPVVNHYHDSWRRQRTNNAHAETSKGIFYDSENLYGNRRYEFYVNLINLFDEAIVQDNLEVLSREQQKLLEQYFAEADTITPLSTQSLVGWIYDWDSLHRRIYDLDEFLGSYIGENDGQFAEYRTKQLYQKRQPFSTRVGIR